MSAVVRILVLMPREGRGRVEGLGMASKTEAQDALFAAIKNELDHIDNWVVSARPGVIRELAVAYRLAAGGAQPGGSVVEKA